MSNVLSDKPIKILAVSFVLFITLLGCSQTPKVIETTFVSPPDSPPDVGQIPQVIETIFLSPPGDTPVSAAVNGVSGYVYVLNSNDLLSILQEKQLVATLPVGHQGRPAMAIDEKQNKVYVVNESEDSLTVIQGTQVIATIPIDGRSPTDVAVDPNNGLVYVVSMYRRHPPRGEVPVVEGKLTVIDNEQVVGTIEFEEIMTKFVEVDPIKGYVYLGAVGGNCIVIKDIQEIARYNVGSTVKSMDVDTRIGDVYALYRSANGQQLSRFKNGKLVDSAKIEGKGGEVQRIKVHPVTSEVYVIDYTRQEVVTVQDMEVTARIPVDWQPKRIAIDPLTSNVYVTSVGYDTVTVIQNTEVLTKISVGWYPLGIEVNPANGWVYVTNTNDDSVTVLGFE